MPRSKDFLAHVLSLAAGLLIGCILHYVLYRIAVPVNTFVYFFF
ncbi:MAG TPA: hypothetical protein V6D17_12895 [Candidatus Obscuribacterales bacterium]